MKKILQSREQKKKICDGFELRTNIQAKRNVFVFFIPMFKLSEIQIYFRHLFL